MRVYLSAICRTQFRAFGAAHRKAVNCHGESYLTALASAVKRHQFTNVTAIIYIHAGSCGDSLYLSSFPASISFSARISHFRFSLWHRPIPKE